MKKLLMGTAFLTVIGLAITASQLSCTKSSAQTGTSSGLTQLNIILFQKTDVNSTNNATRVELWTANYDGTNQKQIPITLSAGQSIKEGEARLSPDGKKVFMTVRQTTTVGTVTTADSYIYSCNIDGSDFKKVVGFASSIYAGINGVY